MGGAHRKPPGGAHRKPVGGAHRAPTTSVFHRVSQASGTTWDAATPTAPELGLPRRGVSLGLPSWVGSTARLAAAGTLAAGLLAGAGAAWANPDPGGASGEFSAPPSAGARPALTNPITLSPAALPRPGNAPITTTAPATIAADPVLQQINREEAAVETLAERVNAANTELTARQSALALSSLKLAGATVTVLVAQAEADDFSRDAYMDAVDRPDGLRDDPRAAVLGQPGAPTVDLPVRELDTARDGRSTAQSEVDGATKRVTDQQTLLRTLRAELVSRGSALTTLKNQQRAALDAAAAQRDRTDSSLAGQFVGDATGRSGAPALQAVQYALAQLGKPYVWGAEGPSSFDCSGLVQSAYAAAGLHLPRTARQQYLYTRQVPVTALLPGDLLYFATDKSNWNTIHHVGIYLGGGKMVHAPTTGDVVKVAPVWWAEYFGATRVVAGVNGPSVVIAIPGAPNTAAPRPVVKPTVPAKPATPAKPAVPAKPVTPTVPVTPPTPSTPATPPTTPATPPPVVPSSPPATPTPTVPSVPPTTAPPTESAGANPPRGAAVPVPAAPAPSASASPTASAIGTP